MPDRRRPRRIQIDGFGEGPKVLVNRRDHSKDSCIVCVAIGEGIAKDLNQFQVAEMAGCSDNSVYRHRQFFWDGVTWPGFGLHNKDPRTRKKKAKAIDLGHLGDNTQTASVLRELLAVNQKLQAEAISAGVALQQLRDQVRHDEATIKALRTKVSQLAQLENTFLASLSGRSDRSTRIEPQPAVRNKRWWKPWQ